MRIPKSLSPSAFMLWEKDPDEYAMRYLVDSKPSKSPQPLPASVGSSFDAYVKSRLHRDIFGEGTDPKFEFDTLFCEQVEKHNRDEARKMGLHVFDDYIVTGSYDELLALMEGAQQAPRFEFGIGCDIDGVPLFGYPDCQFIDRHWNHWILDWKVRGYCSKYGASPMKGYRICRDGADWNIRNLTKKQLEKRAAGIDVEGKPSRSHNKEHSGYLEMGFNGVVINQGNLETCDKEWATQLSIYGWLLGEKVGDENVIVAIDEIVGKFMGEGQLPLLRVANHRARVGKEFQIDLHKRISNLWDMINSGWIFRDLTAEESDNKFEMLQRRAVGMATDGSDEEDWYSQIGRPSYR